MTTNFDELSFGICFYNDPSITRLLDSLPKQAQKIIIDGRFAKNPNSQELSDESLRDKIKSYDNVTLIDAPNLEEPEKRNMYLIQNTHKYQINIDSDEYIISADWDKFFDCVKNIDSGIHHILFKTDSGGGTSQYPRLWVNPSHWKYVICHNIFKNNVTGEMIKSGFNHGEIILGILCGFGDELRSQEYLKDTFDYQVKMIEFETPYREKFMISGYIE